MLQKALSAFQKKTVGVSTPAAFPIFGIVPTITGKAVSASSAMRVPAVACAVSLIAETVGSLPVKLYEQEDRAAVKGHSAYKLIHDEANPWTSAQSLREQLTTDALLHGQGYALVVRNGVGDPVELHRLAPETVQFETDGLGEPTYLVQLSDGRRSYAFQDILHVQAFGGASPITLGREAIGLALAFEEHISKLFANGASPGGIITAPKTVQEEAKAKLKASWLDGHSGPKAGGVALLDEGMQYQQITMTLTDAQFAENRLEQIREIARIFRVPPTMLFELTRGTWSNTEEMARQFLQVTLKPWLTEWAWAYARCLLTADERRDLYVEFVTDDLTTTDTAARAAAYGQYRSMGVMTANEVRSGLNLTPRGDGDTLQNPYTTTGAAPAPSPKEIPNE
ncbi:phage portal protein [Salipiger bermudensis]|uniref:phage portal protein n=1 Tax=Salipiger bermudensis TaxID=344736 RepID=UPI001CD62569|nr:phage portal protein [Salipiger bermudensis]MCA1286253.1 phage portal protein [Salipiger bermudensis]